MILLWFSGSELPPLSSPLPQPPPALHLCHLWRCVTAQKSAFKGTLWFRALRNDITIKGPNCTITLCQSRAERQSLPQSHCNRCAHSSIEERARGSRLTTIGRVVQSQTPEPKTLSVLYGRVEPALVWGRCVFSLSVLWDLCWQVFCFTAYQCGVKELPKNDERKCTSEFAGHFFYINLV